MKSNPSAIFLGNRDAALITSATDLVDLLQKSKRPVLDAAFTSRESIWSKTATIAFGGISITASSCSPMHFSTAQQPQFTLVVPIAGSGVITEKRRSIKFGGANILRCSFHNRATVDYDTFSGVSIKMDVDALLDELNIQERYRSYVGDRIQTSDTKLLAPASSRINYYDTILATLRMFDSFGLDEMRITRIGLDKLLIKLVSTLALQSDPELEQYASKRPLLD